MPVDIRTLLPLLGCVVAALLVAVLPQWLDLFTLLSLTIYLVMALLALSLAFIWGFGGILCFGQAAFFGLGAYAYAIGVINLGDSTWPVLLAIVVPALVAAAMGYFMFYGGISDVYLGVITLAVTLILFNVMNSTSGSDYHIGSALLGGFNGIPAIPTLNVPFNPERVLEPETLFQVIGAALILCYLGLRALLGSRFGKVVVAIRENEQRAGLLGYDTRLHKLIVFSLGGGIAGLAGCLFANWGAFVSPGVFGLAQSAQIIIWVIVGGRGTLFGPILACIGIQALMARLGEQQQVDSGFVLGLILLAFVMLLPRGLLPTLTGWVARVFQRRAQPTPAQERAL
ncbi:branched-chain amino acid ABC transporter permease [Pseudomonas syringae]|uniref:Branched-chain amino acid ABC transporter permease n=1 Tax=Pseudomonas syringae TaxID=317 RepID=A0A9Q3X4S6_PSESX|nr:branched-chain amino acid ABC transporter permease [Pseudomonas syringae]MCF5062587.1 branched-chain amino acid ABC transporter permease [Pseudomonas syringae]MCF5076087.1 branched-chain amino acid ABC transporter permease [Pseudomonas syringae]MCF5118495.1 branched-chain amino acid ABC transporter permease [Pseudomonas syringae]MCF5379294.1 branched-chain amino acid ABC transporter permease [Pseudomonas syringae]